MISKVNRVSSKVNKVNSKASISIKYFAALAECADKTKETYEIQDTSVYALYEELQERYKFPYELEDIRIAINQAYINEDTLLHDGDEVVFITPVAGG